MNFRSKKDGTHFPVGGKGGIDANTFKELNAQDKIRHQVTEAHIDETAVREAELWAMNDSQLYHSTHEPWVQNVSRKMKKKTFEMEKLVPAITKYYVPRVIQSYDKSFGGNSMQLDKASKMALGRRLAELIVQDAEDRLRNP